MENQQELEEQLTQLMVTQGCDIWSLIDASIAMAARDRHADLVDRRDSIIQSLFACQNCAPARLDGYVPVPTGSGQIDGHVSGNLTCSYRIDRHVSVNLAGSDANDGHVSVNLAGSDRIDGHVSVNFTGSERIDGHVSDGLTGSDLHGSDQIGSDPDPIEESPETETVLSEIQEDEMHNEREKKVQISRIKLIKTCFLDKRDDDEKILMALRELVAMDVSYASLKETDIGRQVNSLRKHPSSEVRKLVKQIVRKWKEIVDAWVRNNSSGGGSSPPAIPSDSESPPLPSKNQNEMTPSSTNYGGPASVNGSDLLDTKSKPASRNGSDYSPKPASNKSGGSSNGSVKSGSDSVERKVKPDPSKNRSASSSASPAREDVYNAAKLDSARKRLQENYKEVNNAKKQRTVQVMGLHEIPRPKNSFIKKGGPTGKQK